MWHVECNSLLPAIANGDCRFFSLMGFAGGLTGSRAKVWGYSESNFNEVKTAVEFNGERKRELLPPRVAGEPFNLYDK